MEGKETRVSMGENWNALYTYMNLSKNNPKFFHMHQRNIVSRETREKEVWTSHQCQVGIIPCNVESRGEHYKLTIETSHVSELLV